MAPIAEREGRGGRSGKGLELINAMCCKQRTLSAGTLSAGTLGMYALVVRSTRVLLQSVVRAWPLGKHIVYSLPYVLLCFNSQVLM